MKASYILVLILVCMLGAGSAFGTLYPFTIFTNDGDYNDDPGVNIYMDVDNGGNIAKFSFYNDSTVESTVTRIYFDDGTLLGATQGIINGPGTDFVEKYPGPGDVPGHNIIDFNADREFNIGADSPPPVNGISNIGVGEWVTIEFELVGGTLQDVLNELNDGSLRVALHIQAFADGSSESAVNAIPEPATVLLLGLGGLVLRKRRA